MEKRMWWNIQNAYDSLKNHSDPDPEIEGNLFENLEPCWFGDILENARYKVMQYTGLKDKNNKPIYEGDVLRRHMTSGWEQYPKGVNWDNVRACWHDGANPFVTAAVYEIIGNIYANPDILK